MTNTTYTTAREITFTAADSKRVVVATRKFPAGTTVYASNPRYDGTIDIRVPGSQFTQNVYPSALTF